MDYADVLLTSLGLKVEREPGVEGRHPALSWAASGGMALTGAALPQMVPWPLASAVDGVALALRALGEAFAQPFSSPLPDARTLGERAALAGLQRQGSLTAGGGGRLLAMGDGVLALSLPREEDWALLPAWLETEVSFSPDEAGWHQLAEVLAHRSLPPLLERARLMGLAAAQAEDAMETGYSTGASWYRVKRGVQGAEQCSSPQPVIRPPCVVDMSSLWAGPLCGHLLQRMGAQVIKVESLQRPDGARQGPKAFFDLMNQGKASVALDFGTAKGRAQLQALLEQADIVIEASRPRALRQLGMDAERLIVEHPGLTWLSLSGYGRGQPQEDWIAYGDDAGVAAGLSARLQALCGEWFFCGDAIADPLTGWHAALAGLAGYYSGGGLISLSLVEVVRHCAQFRAPRDAAAWQARWQDWQSRVQADAIEPPTARHADEAAPALGADTVRILSSRGIPC